MKISASVVVESILQSSDVVIRFARFCWAQRGAHSGRDREGD
ncbi:hypothetical protein J3D48_003571 [Pseudomonas fluorescens]|nr:hypothetical protein [Pseudomonas fluorescens]